MSGLRRKLLSTATGPRLLKPAMVSLEAVAPTVKLPGKMAAGELTEEQRQAEIKRMKAIIAANCED